MKNKMRFIALATLSTLCLNTGVGYAKNADELIDSAANALKEAVQKVGDDARALQEYLDHYSWKGIVQDKASSGVATLSHMALNDNGRVVVVKPGERIKGEVICAFDTANCNALELYRVVLGIKRLGAQTTIGNVWGSSAGKSLERFVLIAPKEPGLYQIRFRTVCSLLEGSALKAWVDESQQEPDSGTTVGLIWVH